MRILIVAAALAVGFVTTQGTVARWVSTAVASTGILTAGDLSVMLTGTPIRQYTAGATVSIPATGYLARPGDTFTITQTFTPTLTGNNLRAIVGVQWASGQQPAVGTQCSGAPAATCFSARYRVLSGAIVLVPHTNIGTMAEMAPTASFSASTVLTLEITLAYGTDMADTFGLPPGAVTSYPMAFDAGSIELTLRQVRQGAGYLP